MKTITKIYYNKKDAKEAIEYLAKAFEGVPLPIKQADKKYWQYFDKEVEKENIPLLCEYSLYALLGKDEARSILSCLRILAGYLRSKVDF